MAFSYEPLFSVGPDATEYRLLTRDGVRRDRLGSEAVLRVDASCLAELAAGALREVNFLLRPRHQELVGRILRDPEASDNDRYVARTMLQNAVIAAERRLPFCQDTGTALIFAKKGERVWTGGDDRAALSEGVWRAYTEECFRYSQLAPLSMYEERNTGCNLPAQIDIEAVAGSDYRFLFMAKGGGSANKTYLFQMTKAVLNSTDLPRFLVGKMAILGTAACPPYHVAFVVGGTSAEAALKAVKLASAGYLDGLPGSGSEGGRAFRDAELEQHLLEASRTLGLGAQFGGKYFCHDVRVVRLPRHSASLPVAMAVSCSADRNLLAHIDGDGVWVEKMELDPGRFLDRDDEAPGVAVELDRPMPEILAQLRGLPVRTRLALTGKLVVARDLAHAKVRAMVAAGEPMPAFFREHPIYYAGPAKTPEGMATGSLGPTTSQRMDPYVAPFQALGGSLVMVGKGNRAPEVAASCRKYGGVYLGSIGGPAALLASRHIRSQRVLAFPELGMEAVREIVVEEFPAFVLIDDQGRDFFGELLAGFEE